VINEGELAFGGTSDHLRAAVISGAGLLSKSGSGTLNLNVGNTYTGGTRVDSGIVNVNNINALGTGAVTNNGTLNIIGGNNVTISGLSLSLSGAGVNNVTLGTGAQSTYLNGNYSEFTGTWNIGISGTNGPGRATMTGLDNSAATINVLSNSTLWVYGAGVHNAAVVLNGGDTGESYGQLRVDTAEWAGPITLASPITSVADGFIGSANTDGIISGIIGEVNGPFEFSKVGPNKTTLTGTNTFRGPVWVKAGAVSVPSINEVGSGTGPLGSPLTAAQATIKLGQAGNGGTLIYTGTNVVTARIIELAGTTGGAGIDQSGTNALVLTGGMTISGTGNKTLTLQGSTLGTGEFTGSITNGNGSVIALTKNGTGTWTLSGTNSFTGAVALNNGSLVLSNTSSNSMGGTTVKGSGLLTINGPTTLGANTLTLGNAAGERTMALISADVTMGKLFASYTTAGAAGSVIQNSGTVLVGTGTTGADVLSLGTYGGYGYYRKNGGTLATGQLALTGNNNNSGNVGVFDLFGGTVDVVPNNGWLIFGWQAGHGVFNIFDGSVYSPPGNNDATLGYSGNNNFGMVNMLGSGALLDVTGKGTVRAFNLARSAGNKASVFNLNAGVCLANRIWAQSTATPSFVNFNGGSLRANTSAANFLQGLTAATVYPGGAVIDSSNATITVVQPLLAPTDYGVASVNVTSGGAGYIGAPVVMITGGSGTNATAIASVDLNMESVTYGQVTSIQVTSPGVRYQPGDILTVTCIGGGYTNLASATATLGVNSNSGGLTKLGTGSLTLSGVNTYGGETTISSGTLRLGVANALPTNSVVNVNGGIYDLGAFTVTNRAVNVTSGSVINGTLNSADITKDGTGLLTFGVLQSTAAPIVINGGTMRLKGGAGLYEGRVNGAFELGFPNPQTSIKLSPTNAYTFFANNGASGGIWADNTTYIYSGYIWNRSPTNETWTFCKSFDDSVLIMVDGKPVINVFGNWDTVVTANYVVTPGPHAFEVRLGQGTGGVGQAPNKTVPGAGFDRLGRSNSAFCVPIVDPGDGSLLTLGGKLADGSTVELAADALLDLDDTAQTLAGLSGSGIVSNGTLTVTGVVSPAGTNVIGTLTAKANTTLSGTLAANVATDGTCDLLDVQGNLDLLSPTLEIQNLQGLSTLKMYTLVTCSGTLTGTFTPTNLPDRWALRYTTDGKVQLYYKGGTMIRIM
jgi:autotransporter-associated beta strand protein